MSKTTSIASIRMPSALKSQMQDMAKKKDITLTDAVIDACNKYIRDIHANEVVDDVGRFDEIPSAEEMIKKAQEAETEIKDKIKEYFLNIIKTLVINGESAIFISTNTIMKSIGVENRQGFFLVSSVIDIHFKPKGYAYKVIESSTTNDGIVFALSDDSAERLENEVLDKLNAPF